jgi:maltose/moltooligosaccharide transporter
VSIAEKQVEAVPDRVPPPDPSNGLWRWLTQTKPEYRVGTLQYTGFGLIMVFVWLLWGDFIFTLLDGNVPGILPLKLKELGAGDTTNMVLNKTFAYAMAFLFAPLVSFRSDRTRTRWGRRLPYLIWSTPFVGLFLILIGYYDTLTNLFTGGADQVQFLGATLGQGTVKLIVFGALLIGWDFANIFVNTVYWYLFNDVVPSAYLSRFLSLFRIVGTLAGMAYNEWVFPHSMTHFRTVFVVAGIAYVVGFLMMCFFIREGEYPPPPENVDGGSGLISAIKTFWRECFTHRLYWYFFLANTCTFMCMLSGTFTLVRNTGTLGIEMKDLGRLGTWTLAIGLLLQYPAGWVADRWHPLRVYVFSHIWYMLGTIAACVWIFRDFGPRGNLVFMYWITLIFMPLNAIANASELPMYMRLLPKDRYGQFCAANAMVRAFAMIFGSTAAGMFIGALAPYVGEWRYRYVPVWTLAWQIPAAVLLVLLYLEWKRQGGDRAYVPPGVKPPPGFSVAAISKDVSG